jgi:hypothetical protein
MKKIIVCWIISFVLIACSNSSNEKTKAIDTTIIGSDNPNPAPDTTGMGNKKDTLKK